MNFSKRDLGYKNLPMKVVMYLKGSSTVVLGVLYSGKNTKKKKKKDSQFSRLTSVFSAEQWRDR